MNTKHKNYRIEFCFINLSYNKKHPFYVTANIQTKYETFLIILFCVCVCVDINECLRSVCPSHQQCKNTDGGYQCFDSCSSGMTLAETGVCVGKCQQNLENKNG